MGKIHEALQRAEEQRAKLAEPASAAIDAAVESATAPPAAPDATRFEEEEADVLQSARRSRVVITGGDAVVTEEYRVLRARLQSIRRTRDVRTIAITSSRAGEGKTTTAVNLALSFGLDREANTCLVDADLRTPRVHMAFPEAPKSGLAEVLETDAKLEDALIRIPDTRLSILAVKALPSYPSELLASRRMADLVEELRSRFDTVIFDSPPVLGLPDAVTLVDICDSALIVVGAGKVARAEVDSAIERLDRTKIIGTVFNRVDKSEVTYGRGYYTRE